MKPYYYIFHKWSGLNIIGENITEEVGILRRSGRLFKSDGVTDYMYGSNLERVKTLEYLLNLIRAGAYSCDGRSILLFFTDLFPRHMAQNSWEKSFTNEILAQLDVFQGIVIFATNDIRGLDSAALRRFRFKIEFKPLTAEGNLFFYNRLLRTLVRPEIEMATGEVERLKNMKKLAPGDFAVVRDQFSFGIEAEITHQMLIDSLAKEVSYKQTEKTIIGLAGRAA